MDDFGAPSLFDYATSSHSSMSATLEINTQSGLDSTAWIQGFSDANTANPYNQTNTFHSKTSFLQSNSDPMGLESLINAPVPHTQASALDPLELILNTPSVSTPSPFSNGSQTTVSSPAIVPKTEPVSDIAILNALHAASSHNAPQIVVSTHNALQGPAIKSEPSSMDQMGVIAQSETPLHEEKKPAVDEPIKTEPEPAIDVPKEVDPAKDLNLAITNVVTSFRVRCHLNLRRIAQEGINVIYQKESKKIVMKVRHPSATAYMWSSGKIICTGANSELNAKKASRKFAKRLQNIGFQVSFSNYKVINVLAVCKMPYHIDIVHFSEHYKSKHLSYEPEIHPAVTYRMPEFKVTFKIFSTGSITLTCPVVERIPEAIKKVYPMVFHFFKLDQPNNLTLLRNRLSESDGANHNVNS